MTREQEREFLIRLAATWLLCRWRVMGHKVTAHPIPSELGSDLLGCHDYAAEMRLAVEEYRAVQP